MQSNKVIKITLITLMAMIFAVVILYAMTTTAEFGAEVPTKFEDLGGDFTLQTAQGEIALQDFQGQVVVMYFGFLNCPDVCPNSMLTITKALKKLTPEQKSNVQVIMVSVDPNRDALDELSAFAAYYHPNIIGATGSVEVIDQLTDAYAAYYTVNPSDSESEYEVTHSSRYYVINSQGELVDAMRHSTTANELAARIRLLFAPTV